MNLQTLSEIKLDIVSGKKPYYVYLLFKPDGTPFYVGKGRSKRISAHEAETRYFLNGRKWCGLNTFKLNTIAKLWHNNEIVRYQIDSWHDENKGAGEREIELVEQYGRRILGSGPLTNIRDGGDLMTEECCQHLSEVLQNYCIEHPEFIENLQREKNNWIKTKPEEYEAAERKRLEICQSESHREKVAEIMRGYFRDHPDEMERLKRQGAAYFEDNPEAREQARQNSIRNNTGQNLVDWYASDDPEIQAAKREKWDSHSEWLSGWHETEEGKKKTKQAAAKRNEKVRTKDHRQHMANKTAEYIRNNPEADKLRREKAAQTIALRMQKRQEQLQVIQNELFDSGKIKKKHEYVTGEMLYSWKKKGLI